MIDKLNNKLDSFLWVQLNREIRPQLHERLDKHLWLQLNDQLREPLMEQLWVQLGQLNISLQTQLKW